MPILDNPQHELFAQGVAKGMTLVAAYEKAGYEPHDSNAARLIGNDRIADRVAELQELAAKRTLVTIDRLTDELEDARQHAMKDEKGASAAVSAIMGKAKLHGLDVNKHDIAGLSFNISISKDAGGKSEA